MLKKLSKLIFFFLFMLIPFSYNSYTNNKLDNIIENKIKKKEYDGYIYFKKFDKKIIIQKGEVDKVLKNNNIAIINNGSFISDKVGNIVLAGHNTKDVFSILYKLKYDDEIIINNYYENYVFIVYEIKTINIEDTYILDNIENDKIVTLITCTYDNQKRFIVRAKYKSHNFT